MEESIEQKEGKTDFVFTKENYILLLISIAIIVVGFILMSGGQSEHPDGYNPEIFSHRRITYAPIIVIAGFVFAAYAIMKKTNAE